MNQTILFLLADCPGYFVQLFYNMAQTLRDNGQKVVFASTTPYYEQYKGFRLPDLGETYYFSDYLERNIDPVKLDEIELNYWLTYPTFVRDRYFAGHHRNDWNVYKKAILFHQEILEKHRPDVVVSEPPSNSFFYTAFHLMREQNIPYLGYISARLPGYVNVFLDEFGENLLPNLNEQTQPTAENSGIPDYMQDQSISLNESGAVTKIWRMATTPTPYSLESGNTVLHQLQAYYKRLWRKQRYTRALKAKVFAQEVDFQQKISVLHPLHYRPEASTSVLARYYENDLELLKNIAFSLPHNAQLVVKEHKAAVGIRDLSFYRQLLSYPNTILLHPDYNLLAHLSQFDGVVVLTSTVGFEALQLGVPVFILGNVFFANYPEAIRIDSYKMLEMHLRQLTKQQHQPNPEIMMLYRQSCFPGKFNYLNIEVTTPQNIENLLVPVRQILTQQQGELCQ